MRSFLLAVMLVLAAGVTGGARAEVEVQWFGQSALKITTPGGKVILVDPFITKNPKTPDEHKDLSKLGPIDLILLTHGHGDHLGDTVAVAEMTGAKVAMNADMGSTFVALGWLPQEQVIRFNKSGPITPLGPEITVTMVRAEHSSTLRHSDPESGAVTVFNGGEPAGYIISLEDGTTLYLAGDTGIFGDMALIADYYQPDVAFLPIGGHFTMDPVHAAYAVKELLKTPIVVPIHYGTFPLLTGTPDAFKAVLGDFPTEVVVMAPGEVRKF